MADVFILLSGPSVNNLTQEEKDYIQSCHVITVNRYLCFYEMVGIIPNAHLYVDNDSKSLAIIRETYRKYKNNKLDLYTIKSHKKYIDTLGEHNWNIITVDKYNYSSFSHNLQDRLFWCSIAGMAINLSYLINENGSTIKLVGMDGGLVNHFWINDMIDNPKKYTSDARMNLDHSTKFNHQVCNWWNNTSTDIVTKGIAHKDMRFYNCNKDSHFVTNNLMSYASILPEE